MSLAIALLITLIVPVGIVFLIQRRSRLPVAVPLIAALFALFSLILSAPLNAWIWPLIFGSRRAVGALVLSAITIALTQEFVRFLSFRYVKTMQRHRDHAGALAAGIGHAGLSSILSGLLALGGMVMMSVFPSLFDPAPRQQALAHGGPQIVFQALGQLPLMACSLAFSILVVLAFRRNWLFLAVAVVAHAFVLTAAAIIPDFFWSQALLSLCGGLALIFVLLVLRSNIIAPGPETPKPEPVDRPARIY